MICEPINSGIFLGKIFVRLNENWHIISIKIVYEIIFTLPVFSAAMNIRKILTSIFP